MQPLCANVCERVRFTCKCETVHAKQRTHNPHTYTHAWSVSLSAHAVDVVVLLWCAVYGSTDGWMD